MYKSISILVILFGIASSLPTNSQLIKDDNHAQILELHRVRRANNAVPIGNHVSVGMPEPGKGHVEATGTILDSNGHKVDGSVWTEQLLRDIGRQQPNNGVKLNYGHESSGSTLTGSINNGQNSGSASVGAKVNLYQKGPLAVQFQTDFNKYYRGPEAQRNAQFEAFLNIDVNMMCAISKAYCSGGYQPRGPLN